MAKKLFKTKDELWEGYTDLSKSFHLDNNLSKGRSGRKVYLLGRQLKTGNISLYRYSCHDGKRHRDSLDAVLRLEVDNNIKRENEEILRLQVMATNVLNEDLERTESNYTPRIKNNVRLVDYVRKVGDDALAETGNRHSVYAAMWSLRKHIEIFDADVTFRQIDEDWVRRFIDYLKHDALNLNFTRVNDDDKKKKVKISQNTQHRIIVKLNQVLKMASRGKNRLIASNPMDALDSKEKVSAKPGTREYLDEKEVKILMNTPFKHGKYSIKEAFLFACFTGLRYSDLKRVKMSDFDEDENGRFLKITMQKTRQPLKIFVPQIAFDILPKVENDSPLFYLPKNDYANECLRKWCLDARIKKTVTFHVARHTSATILLSSGIPISIIQKQLGHGKIQTTEIYAKLMDSAQVTASRMFDSKFGNDGKKE